jgi:transposase
VLGPPLVPGDVVILNNLPVHKAARLAVLVEIMSARLLFLPPYSPDFTPIELAFSKLKIYLTSAAALTCEALPMVMRSVLNWISADDAQNWFDHYGDHVH